VKLELNGKEIGTADVPFFDAVASFTVPYAAGTLTATSLDHTGTKVRPPPFMLRRFVGLIHL
jgi:hypothetical protein